MDWKGELNWFAALFTPPLHHLLTARLRLPEFLNAKAPRRQDAKETAA